MYGISRKIRNADPLGSPPPGREALSHRAEAELEALVPQPRTPRRTRHRMLAVAGVAAVMSVVAGALGVTYLLDGAPPPTANQPVYDDTDALEERADLIVRATVRSLAAQDDDGVPETVAAIEVSHVAKGAVRPGGRLAVAYTTPGPDVPEAPAGFVVGGEYVFLLSNPDDAGQTHLVGTFQGWYAVHDRQAVPADPNRVELSRSVLTKLELR